MNLQYHEYLKNHHYLQMIEHFPITTEKSAHMDWTDCLGKGQYRLQQRTNKFRRTIWQLGPIAREDKADLEEIQEREEKKACPQPYPLTSFHRPSPEEKKRYIIFALKQAGQTGLSIKQISNSTGIHCRVISSWLSNNLHKIDNIERVSRAQYAWIENYYEADD